MIERSVYFPGLNGIRFLAAYMVLVDHMEQLKEVFGLRSLWSHRHSVRLGSHGVTIFFVLSGFLITYLLLHEKGMTERVSLKDFYMRRVLRIWPLYFLLTFLAFFCIPHFSALAIPGQSEALGQRFWLKFAMFVCFLPNLAFAVFPGVPYANVLWSVGVEEQFYLVWPLIVGYVRRLVPVLIGIVLAFLLVRTALRLALRFAEVEDARASLKVLVTLVERTRIGCMAIGGFGACLVFFQKERLLAAIYSPGAQGLAAAVLAFSLLEPVRIPGYGLVESEVFSAAVCILILNVSCNPRSWLKLENRPLRFLGKISYGVYCFHLLAVVCVIKCLPPPSDQFPSQVLWNLAAYALATLLTLVMASISFYAWERPFLRQKARFTHFASGEDARL